MKKIIVFLLTLGLSLNLFANPNLQMPKNNKALMEHYSENLVKPEVVGVRCIDNKRIVIIPFIKMIRIFDNDNYYFMNNEDTTFTLHNIEDCKLVGAIL